jgi:hypothetical protein
VEGCRWEGLVILETFLMAISPEGCRWGGLVILGTFLMAISLTQGHKAAPEIFLVQKELSDRATPEEIEEQVS